MEYKGLQFDTSKFEQEHAVIRQVIDALEELLGAVPTQQQVHKIGLAMLPMPTSDDQPASEQGMALFDAAYNMASQG
jgi:hypothetical protein